MYKLDAEIGGWTMEVKINGSPAAERSGRDEWLVKSFVFFPALVSSRRAASRRSACS